MANVSPSISLSFITQSIYTGSEAESDVTTKPIDCIFFFFFYIDQSNIGWKDLDLDKFTFWHITRKMLWQKYTFHTSLLPFLHVVNDFWGAFTHTAIFTLDLWSKECEKDILLFYTSARTETESSGVCVCVMWRRSCTRPQTLCTSEFAHLQQKKKGTFTEFKLATWLFAEFKNGTFGFKRDKTQHNRCCCKVRF